LFYHVFILCELLPAPVVVLQHVFTVADVLFMFISLSRIFCFR